jgi:hypothetical protein
MSYSSDSEINGSTNMSNFLGTAQSITHGKILLFPLAEVDSQLYESTGFLRETDMPLEEGDADLVVAGPDPEGMADSELKDLLLALFEDAIECVLGNRSAKDKRQAEAWFASDVEDTGSATTERSITFVTLCDLLRWEPSWIRKLLAKKLDGLRRPV